MLNRYDPMKKVTIQVNPTEKIKCKICELEIRSHEIHRYVLAFHQD